MNKKKNNVDSEEEFFFIKETIEKYVAKKIIKYCHLFRIRGHDGEPSTYAVMSNDNSISCNIKYEINKKYPSLVGYRSTVDDKTIKEWEKNGWFYKILTIK